MLLLSIKPRYAAQLYAGTKRFEFRRSPPLRDLPGPALLYESRPTGRVTGLLWLDTPILLTPAAIADESADIRAYLAGARRPCALPVIAAERFEEPATLGVVTGFTRAPQSWCYVDIAAISARYRPRPSRSSAARSAAE